jgi:hypothetical protein
MKIRVVGAHLPRLDQRGIDSFIASDVAEWRVTIRRLRNEGYTGLTDEEIATRAAEMPEELDADLQKCALFEVEVRDNSNEFDPSEFREPIAGGCGWEPAFLSMDGERVVLEGYRAPANMSEFRVAFYVHDWPDQGRLVGPTGELSLPEFSAVPERLWKLAPYSCVD